MLRDASSSLFVALSTAIATNIFSTTRSISLRWLVEAFQNIPRPFAWDNEMGWLASALLIARTPPE